MEEGFEGWKGCRQAEEGNRDVRGKEGRFGESSRGWECRLRGLC